MPDEIDPPAKVPAPVSAASQAAAKRATAVKEAEGETEHYEEVAEYRIGEGPPPIALIVMFVMIVAWATLSWIPFFGY